MNIKDKLSLDKVAKSILRTNDRGSYTVPTAGLYPYQWNWDSAFAALGFATFDLDRAWIEIETLFSAQWPNGMVPHIIFHKDDPGYYPGPEVWGTHGIGPISSSGISQPAIAATMIRSIWEQDKDRGEMHLRTLLPKIKAWHKWFMDWRTDENGAVFLTHPWEAGRDNSPDWDTAMAMIDPVGVGEYTRRDIGHVDAAMRPTKADYDRYIWLVDQGRKLRWNEEEMARERTFMVADPTLTFILLRANRDLARMSEDLGEDRTEIDAWSKTLEAGAAQLRNPKTGIFEAINLQTKEFTGHITSASFLCWYARLDDPRTYDALKKCLKTCRYPIPSLAMGSPHFNGFAYWRGPTWAIMNCMIGMGLADMGHFEAAKKLRHLTRDLIAEYGFAEYFHPLTGAPAGGGTFTWTAAVWLAWASPSAGEQ